MNHPEIVRYIEKARQAQMTEGEIRDALFHSGWLPGDIIEAFGVAKGEFVPEVSTAPRHSVMVSVDHVSKSYGSVQALSDVSLEVTAGSILALLGPNGAGKTTLVKILTTLLRPTDGVAYVGGYDVSRDGDDVRRIIGLAGQHAAIDEHLTGRENLEMIGRLSHLNKEQVAIKSSELLERFELVEAADRSAKTYSGGMRRRLDLAASLMSSPQVLFLDEPTTGLDPRSRNELWKIVKELVATGVTILLTTQYLEEADRLADQIAVIDHGRLIAKGTSQELKDMVGGEVVETVRRGPTLDDVFLKLTGHKAEENHE